MRFKCRKCGEIIPDNSGPEHVQETHPEVCDMYLTEYISDSVRDACDELLEVVEEEK